jgi:predicted alpha/beta-hydrolase family hydrolase
MDVLASTFHDVLLAQAARTGSPPGPIFVGGKSLGARVAAAIVAQGRVKPHGLVFLGFPLHKPGDEGNLRTADLPEVKRPMLFVQGTRDPFGSVDLVRSVRRDLRLPGALHVVDGGDHSFAVPKSKAASQRAAFVDAADAIAEFVAKVAGRGRGA